MLHSTGLLSRSFCLIAFPLVVAQFSADAAPVRKHVASAKPKMIAPNNAIIPVPLNPVIPSAQRLCTARTSSGLGYTVLRAGTGAKPASGSAVTVNYIGYLAANGVVFDQNTQSALSLDGVIPGFSEGVQLVARTGVVRICVPSALGYGARATGPIPANADLVFQVELVDVQSSAQTRN